MLSARSFFVHIPFSGALVGHSKMMIWIVSAFHPLKTSMAPAFRSEAERPLSAPIPRTAFDRWGHWKIQLEALGAITGGRGIRKDTKARTDAILKARFLGRE